MYLFNFTPFQDMLSRIKPCLFHIISKHSACYVISRLRFSGIKRNPRLKLLLLILGISVIRKNKILRLLRLLSKVIWVIKYFKVIFVLKYYDD